MRDYANSNFADLRGHVLADALPALARSIDLVDAAVVLMPQAIGLGRMLHHVVRIVAVLVLATVGLGRREVHRDTGVERLPVVAAIARLEDAAARHAQIEMLRIARVD